jgi:hypothetical protein
VRTAEATPRIEAPRTVTATRYVTPLREGGSLPGLVEADDDGLYVLKFRNAAQGPRVLVAELISGGIGRALGLPVPEIVFAELDPALAAAEPDPEVRDLINGSPGLNLGLDFLPGSLPFRPGATPAPDADLAASIVWFDSLVTNPDRTVRNANILMWHGRPWLIDHGATLFVHFTWRDPAEHARQPFARIRDHVLLPYASSIAEADKRLAPVLNRGILRSIAGEVPDAWLTDDALSTRAVRSPAVQREAYVDYLAMRLESPRAWVDAAEAARIEVQRGG